ncbi:MAG: 4-hydroxy-tetrahydrodipicolinate reductase [Actinomycetota bacterium]|nr:4-hydroxy-tetrahydrodipicolinate reductase [Actinomycetota bacterium]
MIRVGVLGAAGRVGGEVCRAVAADPALILAAAVDPGHAGAVVGDVEVSASLDALLDASVEVAVDFTHPGAVMDNVRWCVAHRVHAVVGTTGISGAELEELRALAEEGAHVLVCPNFAIGAVLMMRFAEQAARYLPAAEIVELHHDGKADAPSGTAIATAQRIAAAHGSEAAGAAGGDVAHPGARGADVDGIRVHAVRLPGLLAHQEVILGGPGQTLTIRHDSTDRSSFMPGVLLAIHAIASRPGLTVGIEPLLEVP